MLKGFSCEACRAQHEEAEADVPCDTGGLEACPYEMVELWPENVLAVELYQRARRLGWETTLALLDLELSPVEAAGLLDKLMVIEETLITLQQKGEKHDGNTEDHYRRHHRAQGGGTE